MQPPSHHQHTAGFGAQDNRAVQGRCLIFVVTAIELLFDGLRIPGIALEVLMGWDTYPGTTGWSNNALKFWLSVLKILALPLAVVLCFGPRRVARIGAGLALFTFLAWWLSATYEEFDDLRRYANPDPMRAILGSLRLFSPTAPLLISAYILLRDAPLQRRAAWIWAIALALCTAVSLYLYVPAIFLVGGSSSAPRGAALYVTIYCLALAVTAIVAALKAIQMPPDPERTP